MMKTLTKQEMYDKVWDHFVVNKAPQSRVEPEGSNPKTLCMYEAKPGVMCGIGVLMTREQRRTLKRNGDNTAPVLKVGRSSKYKDISVRLGDDVRFLAGLQSVHDNGDFRVLKNRKALLRTFAYLYDLVSK
jgi:hypothetical protein